MAMKQTQTKLFDFSDVGLDFCAGSKNLFPDRFKKMLALGYNEQTVSSVAVAGNQVTLSYGVSHGYVADRVLKVSAPELLGINGGEFVIDSVTANTVTMTIDGAPTSIAGNFTTKVASLGWSLEYENANIHVYKFKHIDETDLYLRLCFQNVTSRRNCISPCIGHSIDENGNITDANSLEANRSILSPDNGLKWEFSYPASTTHDNQTYDQGFSTFGRGVIIGSKYHFISMHNAMNTNGIGRIVGFVPAATLDYVQLHFPVLFGEAFSVVSALNSYQLNQAQAWIGNIRVVFQNAQATTNLITYPFASQPYLPTSIDAFNTTTALQLNVFEFTTRQNIGGMYGMYACCYNGATYPASTYNVSPSITYDVDVSSPVYLHYMAAGYVGAGSTHFAVPVEEIKIVD